MLKNTLILTAFVSATTTSALAFAQDQTGDAAPPPPPPPPVQTAPEPPKAMVPVAPQEKEDLGGRVRWGVSANLGWHLPQSMFTIGSEGRIGYQISNMLSVYGAIGGTAGFGFGASVGFDGVEVSLNAISYYYLGAIAEAMFGDLFYVGGGPVLANGAIAGITTGVDPDGVAEVTEVASAGIKPGLNIRFGLGFGKPSGPSMRRGGFNLGIDTLTLFHPSSVFVKTRADGPNGEAGASVTTTGLAVSVIPMLTLGYDSR
jgi:hypothetical protein